MRTTFPGTPRLHPDPLLRRRRTAAEQQDRPAAKARDLTPDVTNKSAFRHLFATRTAPLFIADGRTVIPDRVNHRHRVP